MMETKEKNKISFQKCFRLCPVRHILCALALAVILVYLALRNNAKAMEALCSGFVRPWHRFFSALTAPLPFSLGECIIVLGILAALTYIIVCIVLLIRTPERGKRLYRFFLTLVTVILLIYAGFCLLWGPYYYTSDFEEQSGVYGAPISTEQLETVTRYFTRLLNEYAGLVRRNPDGTFAEPLDEIFEHSAALYQNVEQDFPCLSGSEIPAKPFFFSRCMSYIKFTGFFFPFTAEANINVDCPACLIPSTIAHELAHQRGVAQEDEANFVAVLASFESGDTVYCYSSALLAYIHLSNALYRADYDVWYENYMTLSDCVIADLQEHNAYWKQFETPVSTVSDKVYTGFLQSYGQELGLQTYGKCVDLLVAYYYDAALEALK